jgi:hypothetical protein
MHEKIKGIFTFFKICLRDFGGSCKGSATNGEWGRQVGTSQFFRAADGRCGTVWRIPAMREGTAHAGEE